MGDPVRARRHAGFPTALCALAALGAAVSVLSTLDHLDYKRSGGDSKGFCAAIVDSGCASAHSSAAAEILGVPISLAGAAWYLAAALLAVAAGLALRRPSDRGWRRLAAGAPVLLLAAGVGSLAYSAWLASVLVRLGQVCPFCAALYAVNAGMTAVAAAWAWPVVRRPAQALRQAVAPGVAAAVLFSAGLAAGYAAYLGALAAPDPPPSPGVAVDPGTDLSLPDRVPSRGDAAAPATLIEVSDLECPFCAQMHETISQLLARRPDRLRVRFVNFPLDTACNCHVSVCLHQTACLASRGAICAGRQGRFWDFADRCYANPGRHTRGDLLGYAAGLGLDRAAFGACLDDPATAGDLADDVALGHRMGVRATPTILLNGVRFEGALDLSRLEELLDKTAVCSCELGPEACSCDGGGQDCACGEPVPAKGACGN
jgi:protein-disulfide isomerase